MNHLRELLELPRGKLYAHSAGGFTDASPVKCALASHAEQAICFDFGDLGNDALSAGVQICDSPVPELCKLPFPVCWFECTLSPPGRPAHHIAILAFAVHGRESLVEAVLFGRGPQGKFWNASVWGAGACSTEGVYRCEGENLGDAREVQMLLALVFGFCQMLNCQNVERQHHQPDPDKQKVRRLFGKQPLFSYWTLSVRAATRGTGEKCGEPTGPRVRAHLRRGHPRQFAPGRWTWVQPCTVGDAGLGLVHKDYFLTNRRT